MKDARKDLALLSPKTPVSSKIYSGAGGRFIAVAFLEERLAGDADWTATRESSSTGSGNSGKTP